MDEQKVQKLRGLAEEGQRRLDAVNDSVFDTVSRSDLEQLFQRCLRIRGAADTDIEEARTMCFNLSPDIHRAKAEGHGDTATELFNLFEELYTLLQSLSNE